MTVNLKNATAPKEAAALQTTQKVESKEVKKTETKDTLTSASQTTPATKKEEKSFMEKVKDCCASILNWLKEHIFCCFFKKKTEGSESATETKNKTETKNESSTTSKTTSSDANNEALIKKAKEGLNAEDGKKFDEMLNKAMEISKKTEEESSKKLEQIAHLKEVALTKECEKEASEFIKQFGGTEKDLLTTIFKNDRNAFVEALDAMSEPFKKFSSGLSEQMGFCIMIGEAKGKDLIAAKAIYCSFSAQARTSFLEMYKKISGKSDITEEQFLALILQNPDDQHLKALGQKIEKQMSGAELFTPYQKKLEELAKKVSKTS